ncbi:MAG: translation initiation factor [Pseudobdellovibrionaceae bacterium]|nr:translation initiation factor [Pseudobdellovibrionaceae bacterium]
MADKLVYGTGQGSTRKDDKTKSYKPAPGPTKMRLELKSRGGKTVTVLWNFPFSEDEVKTIIKAIQQRSACGATFKDGRAEFQGDVKDKALAYFQEQGWKLQQAGG